MPARTDPKKSKEYHGTLDLCRLPGVQMAKVDLHALQTRPQKVHRMAAAERGRKGELGV